MLSQCPGISAEAALCSDVIGLTLREPDRQRFGGDEIDRVPIPKCAVSQDSLVIRRKHPSRSCVPEAHFRLSPSCLDRPHRPNQTTTSSEPNFGRQ